MSGFTKLDSEILTSTIWAEDLPTKVVWITILAMMDKRSEVHGSIPGLARIAGVQVKECEAAILKMMQPDKHSRSKEFEGRRLREIDGGWVVLNGDKYRKKYSMEWRREQDACRARERRARRTADADQSPTEHRLDTDRSVSGFATRIESLFDEVPLDQTEIDETLKQAGIDPTAATESVMKIAHSKLAKRSLEGTGQTLLTLACVGQGPQEFPVRESLVLEWTAAYPGIDVLGELRKAIQWCADNPTKQKTYRGARKFLGSWLSRAQESRAKGGPNGETKKLCFAPAYPDEAFTGGERPI